MPRSKLSAKQKLDYDENEGGCPECDKTCKLWTRGEYAGECGEPSCCTYFWYYYECGRCNSSGWFSI